MLKRRAFLGSSGAFAVGLAAASCATVPSVRIASRDVMVLKARRANAEIWFLPDHSNPVLSLRFVLPQAGAWQDDEGREGLGSMLADLLDQGAGPFNETAFAQERENRSISMGFFADYDDAGASLRTLSDYAQDAVTLLRLALFEPRLEENSIERARRQMLASLRFSKTDPGDQAWRLWRGEALRGHPYANPLDGTEQSLARITRDELIGARQSRLTGAGLIVGACGDIAPDRLVRLLDDAFAPEAAPRSQGEAPRIMAPARLRGGNLWIRRLTSPQSVAIFGQEWVARNHPDWYAGLILNEILGGGFTSRLYSSVREKRGLAYSVGTNISPRDGVSLLIGSVATRNEAIASSIEVIRSEWGRLRDEAPSGQEISIAKNKLIGSFPARLVSTRGVAGVLASMRRHGLPRDYLSRRADLIASVTQDDITRVAQERLDPDGLAFAVVGEPKDLIGIEA